MKAAGMGFWIFISIFFAIGFGLLGWGLFCLYKTKAAEGWSETRGAITACELGEDSGSESTTWHVKVAYNYVVAGRTYSGSRIAFGYAGSSIREEHEALHAKLRDASVVRVRYNPTKPEEAVLGTGLNRSNLILIVFATVWLMFTTGFTVLWTMSSGKDARLIHSIQVIEAK